MNTSKEAAEQLREIFLEERVQHDLWTASRRGKVAQRRVCERVFDWYAIHYADEVEEVTGTNPN
jgi:hypothetical protein